MAAGFDPVVECRLEPVVADLAARLDAVGGLGPQERRAVREATIASLRESVWRRTSRVLVLELYIARISGRLTAADSRARWSEWLAGASRPGFWESLVERYPALPSRLHTVIENRCAAAVALARRLGADRAAIDGLLGGESGELVGLELGAGDSHAGGQTVAILRFQGGRVVYKPRSLAVDAVLGRLLPRLLPHEPAAIRIRVPAVVCREGYGWAEFVGHRYCADDGELAAFYRGIGHWLAVLRLLGGNDIHQENLIAAGPVPVVVDCETLFRPYEPSGPSGYGGAVDRAYELVNGSVLRIGLLPGRGGALGWRGVDMSGAGSLPGQQPRTRMTPVVVDAGTDLARVALREVPVPTAPTTNHPSPNPALRRYWQHVVSGFEELTGQLRRLDRAGHLEPMLAEFTGCRIRVVPRATEAYSELLRMLWHPVSLHDEPAAVRRAAEVLAGQAENAPGAPSDPVVIDAEVGELLDSDVPLFTTTPERGWLSGPRGTRWGEPRDLIAEALRRWREADAGIDRQVIEASVVSAYLTEDGPTGHQRLTGHQVRTEDLDRRRRRAAAGILRELRDRAIQAEDGTVTWIAPVLSPTGWVVTPLAPDLYGGGCGVAVLLAAYLHETAQGRADRVFGLAELLSGVLSTLRMGEDQAARRRAEPLAVHGARPRPESPGGYLGLGSRICGWLWLARLGAVPLPEAIARAEALADLVPEAVAADTSLDLLNGIAGATVPLLRLAEHTGNRRYAEMAAHIGARLRSCARRQDGGARWPTQLFPDGIGGLSHGSTGIGWALSRLAAHLGDSTLVPLAEAAFAYEESLYDSRQGGWLDLREPGRIAAAWCHGAAGIGVVAVDLLAHHHSAPWIGGGPARWRDVLGRAARSCWQAGTGWSHTLCHGDAGGWEVMTAALAIGTAPAGLDRATIDAQMVSSIEEHGPVGGMARATFSPGLLAGVGGTAYQLLRMHPDSDLPSVLLPDPGPPLRLDGSGNRSSRVPQQVTRVYPASR
jgi:type 2 lantibiotic biosynthesis protein LanM